MHEEEVAGGNVHVGDVAGKDLGDVWEPGVLEDGLAFLNAFGGFENPAVEAALGPPEDEDFVVTQAFVGEVVIAQGGTRQEDDEQEEDGQ